MKASLRSKIRTGWQLRSLHGCWWLLDVTVHDCATQTSLCQPSLKDTIMDNSETLEVRGTGALSPWGSSLWESASMTYLWMHLLALDSPKVLPVSGQMVMDL